MQLVAAVFMKSGRRHYDRWNQYSGDDLGIFTSAGGTVQQMFFFPGTIRENIAYGKLDATEEEILKAVKLAHLEKVIDQNDGWLGYGHR